MRFAVCRQRHPVRSSRRRCREDRVGGLGQLKREDFFERGLGEPGFDERSRPKHEEPAASLSDKRARQFLLFVRELCRLDVANTTAS